MTAEADAEWHAVVARVRELADAWREEPADAARIEQAASAFRTAYRAAGVNLRDPAAVRAAVVTLDLVLGWTIQHPQLGRLELATNGAALIATTLFEVLRFTRPLADDG